MWGVRLPLCKVNSCWENLLVVITVLLAFTEICIAQVQPRQVHRVSPEEILDTAHDLKRVAEQADKLTPLGTRDCRWRIAPLDASDLDAAISRFLLNHSSTVPTQISASAMGRVLLVADDLTNQLAMGMVMCYVGAPFNPDTGSTADSAWRIWNQMEITELAFRQLAFNQAVWEDIGSYKPGRGEQQGAFYDDRSSSLHSSREVTLDQILGAARDLLETSEVASRTIEDARKVKECSKKMQGETSDLSALNELIVLLGRTPPPSSLPAWKMWDAGLDADGVRMLTIAAIAQCSPASMGSKKVNKALSNAVEAFHNLRTRETAFEKLTVQQTEWEEDELEIQNNSSEH